MKTLRLTCTLTLAILAAQTAPAAAQRSAEDWPPEYAHGRVLINAEGSREGCVPEQAVMVRVMEGELTRAGLRTGPNVHHVTIHALALGQDLEEVVNSQVVGCTTQLHFEVRAKARSPSGMEVQAVLHEWPILLAWGPKSHTQLKIRDYLRDRTAEVAYIIQRHRSERREH